MDLKIFKETLGKIPIGEEYFLFVMHLTKTIEPYLSEWVKSCKNIGIISIPYSENKEVKERLACLTNVYEVPDYKEIPSLIKTLCKEHSDEKIILIEIGGYSSEVSKYLKNVILSVEDTNQGYWRFKTQEKNLSYPVVSIARTELKSLENKLVGQSVVFSVERILRDCFNQGCLTTKEVLVLSYGQIGKAVCQALRGRFSRIFVYDINPLRMTEAYLDGFNIVDKKDALPHINIIIGASGSRSIAMDDTPLFKNRVILVSASSRQVEFPYEYLDIYKTQKEFQSKGIFNHIIEEFEILKGKTFFVVFKGQPINFIDDSAFGDTFELVLAGLAQSVRYALENNLDNRLYDLPEKYQLEVAEPYYRGKLLDFPKRDIQIHQAATAFLFNWDKKLQKWRILLVDHKKIRKLIPVGGHVELKETPEDTVRREVLEETNSSISFFWDNQRKGWVKKPILFSIQIEEIPALGETIAHFHEDYMYVGYLPEEYFDKIATGKKSGLYWIYVDDILANPQEYNVSQETLKTLRKLNIISPPDF